MIEEEWKDIIDYENYSISNYGNVKNNKTNKILKNSIDRYGYYKINLSKNNKGKHFKIHRLVAIHFIDNPDNKKCVDHIDNNPLNNHINNLRWATYQENNRNSKKKSNCSSIYKGVSKRNNKWETKIGINKKRIHLGYFDTQEEAAQKYNDYILEHNLQEFFKLNSL